MTFILASFFGLPAYSCEILKSYELEETKINMDVVEQAISVANKILGENVFIHGCKKRKGKTNVFWVGHQGLTKTRHDMMFVLEECNCIIIQGSVFFDWLNQYSGKRGELELIDIGKKEILVYFLLHELGHIRNKHPGRAINKKSKHYNVIKTKSKKRETIADLFASNMILEGLSNAEKFDRWMATSWVSVELGQLSFNLQGIRSIEEFGGTYLNLPRLFQDKGKSHPNFELRVLQINHDIQQTEDSKILLDSFIKHQKESISQDGVLYRK